MSIIDRKAAITNYKEKTPEVGIFAVRCATSGEVWVGATTALDKRWNRLSFVLRSGSGSTPAIHAAYAMHGTDAFCYEILERYTKDDSEAEFQEAWLKSRLAHWRAVLSAGIAR